LLREGSPPSDGVQSGDGRRQEGEQVLGSSTNVSLKPNRFAKRQGKRAKRKDPKADPHLDFLADQPVERELDIKGRRVS